MGNCFDCHRNTMQVEISDPVNPWLTILRCTYCYNRIDLANYLKILISNIGLNVYFDSSVGYRATNEERQSVLIFTFDGKLLTITASGEYFTHSSQILRKFTPIKKFQTRLIIANTSFSTYCCVCHATEFHRVKETSFGPTIASCDHFQITDYAYLYSIFQKLTVSDNYILSGTWPNQIISIKPEKEIVEICEIKPRWGMDRTIVLIQQITNNKKLFKKVVKQLKAALPAIFFEIKFAA